MYIKKTKKKIKLLTVDENFVTLVGVDSNLENQVNSATFLFSFKISKFDAIKFGASTVEITVKKPSIVSEPKIIPSSKTGISLSDSRQIVKNILSHNLKILNVSKTRSEAIIASKTADVFSKISNQTINALRTNQPVSNLGLEKTQLIVKSKKEKQLSGDFSLPIKVISNISSEQQLVETDSKKIRLELLKKHSISPAEITKLPDKNLYPYSAFTGTFRNSSNSRYAKNDSLNELYNSNFTIQQESIEQEQYEISVSQFFDDIAVIDVPITINDFLETASTNLTISFELMTSSNERGIKQSRTLEKVEKSVNLLEYLKRIESFEKLNVGFAVNDSNVSISINRSKNDKVSLMTSKRKKINVYKKNLVDSMNEKYSLIRSEEFFDDSIQNFSLDVKNDKLNSIYRVQIDGQTEFEDFVIKNDKEIISKKVVLVPRASDNNIIVDVFNNSVSEVEFVKILYRNASTKSKDFIVVDIIPSSFQSTSTVFINDLIPYHVYEITSELILKGGGEIMSNYSTFVEYIPSSTRIPVVLSNYKAFKNDVQFDLSVNYLHDQIGGLKRLLDQVSAKYDEEALLNRTAQFDKFFAFDITRYNTTTAEVENLGILYNSGSFIDSEMSLKASANQIEQGCSYAYVIYPLIRNPDDVINESRELIDEETLKKYKINPRKDRHPLALINGSSISQRFLDSNPKQDMLYGKLGNSIVVNFSSYKSEPEIKNFKVEFLDKNRLILSWKVSKTLSDFEIDHFLIMKEINGVKSIIGKSHAFYENLFYIHEISKNDLGTVRFLLTPIYGDYSSGIELVSNYVLCHNL